MSDPKSHSEAQAAQTHERLLIKEVNHRVRNMLQVVIGLANQTLRRSHDLASFEKAYLGRLQALARAYELLARQSWRAVPLAELLRLQRPDTIAAERFTLSGPHVTLNPSAALSLGLVLHELATHACQVGAFTQSTGRIAVRWSIGANDAGDERLQLDWVERGAPAGTAATFSCELVTRQLKHELRADTCLDFTDTGLTAKLLIPCEEVLELQHS